MKCGCFHNFFQFFQTFMSVFITEKKERKKIYRYRKFYEKERKITCLLPLSKCKFASGMHYLSCVAMVFSAQYCTYSLRQTQLHLYWGTLLFMTHYWLILCNFMKLILVSFEKFVLKVEQVIHSLQSYFSHTYWCCWWR